MPLTACVIHKTRVMFPLLPAGFRPQSSNSDFRSLSLRMTQSLNSKTRREPCRKFIRQKQLPHFSLLSPILILPVWEKWKRTTKHCLFEYCKDYSMLHTQEGSCVFLGINSWQHSELLSTCATAQRSYVNHRGRAGSFCKRQCWTKFLWAYWKCTHEAHSVSGSSSDESVLRVSACCQGRVVSISPSLRKDPWKGGKCSS